MVCWVGEVDEVAMWWCWRCGGVAVWRCGGVMRLADVVPACSQWKKVEPALRKMTSSFEIERVRPTSIKRKAKNDYRFEDQGGLNERKDDSVF